MGSSAELSEWLPDMAQSCLLGKVHQWRRRSCSSRRRSSTVLLQAVQILGERGELVPSGNDKPD